MKERILTGWTLTRIFYTGTGLFLIINSVMDRQWFGIVFGTYFTAMGVFSFGCAAGSCYTGARPTRSQHASTTTAEDVQFEEVNKKQSE